MADPVDARILELLEQGCSIATIAERIDRSRSFVTARLRARGWETRRTRVLRENAEARRSGVAEVARTCAVHGEVAFRVAAGGTPRCPRCAAERVANRRRRIKETLVAEHGGRCVRCGYDRCLRALAFHHVDPTTKLFGVAAGGHSRGLAHARAEVAKCVLLCANCHAEVEAGIEPFAYYRASDRG